VHMTGRIIWEVSYTRLANKELIKALIISLCLLILILGILYRSFWGIMIPVLTFLIAGINVFGYLALINRPLNAIANLIPSIILIVSTSDTIHILSKYIHKRNGSMNRQDSLQSTIMK